MPHSIRKVFAALAALAALVGFAAFIPRAVVLTGTTVFSQGALSGGGYVTNISTSDDGATKVISTDEVGAYVYNASTSSWVQLATVTALPSPYNAPNLRGIGSYAIVAAPSDHNRVYWIANTLATTDYGTAQQAQLFESTDGAATFHVRQTAIAAMAGGDAANYRYTGLPIAVDPSNPDILYYANSAGVVFLSTDAGVHVAEVTALSANMIHLTTTAPTAPSNGTLTFSSVPSSLTGQVTNWASNFHSILIYDQTNPAATVNPIKATNATSTTVVNGASPGFAQTNACGVGTSVCTGDNIIFGSMASIAFDRSAGTTASCPTVGGVTPTICSKGVYVGWAYGAAGIYHSTDAGGTWSLTPTTGPAGVIHLAVSFDGTVYATSYDYNSGHSNSIPWAAWAFNQPTATNTWAQLSIVTGNNVQAVAPDPLIAGKVCFASTTATFWCATDYGESGTWSSVFPANPTNGSHGFQYTIPPGEATWMSNVNYFGSPGYQGGAFAISNMFLDPVTSGQIWFADGKGVFTASPLYPPSSSATLGITIRTKGNFELIPQDLDKPSGQALVGMFQDYGIFYMPSVTTQPTQNQPVSLGQSGVPVFQMARLAHALATPTTRLAVGGNTIWKSTDDGQTWAQTSGQPNNPPGYGGSGIAAATSTNYVFTPTVASTASGSANTISGTTLTLGGSITGTWLPGEQVVGVGVTLGTYITSACSGNTAGSTCPLSASSTVSSGEAMTGYSPAAWYTADGGATWVPSIFNSPGTGATSFGATLYPNLKNIAADAVTSGTYYLGASHCLNGQTCTLGTDYGQFWKSTDSGATWSLQSSGKTGGFPSGWNFNSSTASTITAVPGYAGHLFYSPGIQGGGTLYSQPIIRSCDGGATWVQVNFLSAILVAVGKAKPGNTYPSIYVYGNPTTTYPPGYYRADDANSSCNTTLTWQHLSDAPYGLLDYARVLIGDEDTYGTFYFGTAGGGYGYGYLQ